MRSEVPNGWISCPLYDLAEYVNGRSTKPSEVGRGGVPLIKIAELTRGITDATNRVPAENVQQKHWVSDGDLLFAWSGSVGIHIYHGDRAALNQHIFRVEARDGVDQRFLRYCLVGQLPVFHRFVEAKRTTMGHVTVADLRTTTVHIPAIEEQRRIALVLGALDDKIDSNRRLAALLEETAATLFRARFVDFVGVEEFEESEIGPIPRNWCVVPFSKAVGINPRVAVKKGEITPYIEMAAVAPWATRPTDIIERPYTGGARFEPGDTLMARITGCIEHGKGAFVDFLDRTGAGSTEFLVLRAREPLTPEGVFLLSRTERVRAHAIASMSGSSGRQRVQLSAFDHLRIAVPPSRASLGDDANFMRSALLGSRALWRESRTLGTIRDALLPKLISGEIRVPGTSDPEEVIGPVAEELASAAS
jgi:type I restriction enzyme S subunit